MKTNSFWFIRCRRLFVAVICGVILPGVVRAKAQTNAPPSAHPVTSSDSTMVRGAKVYSMTFPGGTTEFFFEFLRTNGFADDNVLFAGKAASTHIPAFAVRHVRLKDVAKSLELVTEGRLKVEVVERGEQSDENIWRIRASEEGSPIKTKTCAMANFFQTPKAAERIPVIVKSIEQVVLPQVDKSGKTAEGGNTLTLQTEKMVIVVGPEAYVEAVSNALEAAEKVAAADVQRQK